MGAINSYQEDLSKMSIEQEYKQATEKYLELLDSMVIAARLDFDTTAQELTYLVAYREFTASILEGLKERIADAS